MDTYDLYIGALSQLCFVDLEQTAEWLVRLGQSRELRARLGSAAQKTIAERFDWKKVISSYFDLWAEQRGRIARARATGKSSSSPGRVFDPGQIFSGFPSHRLLPDTTLARGPTFKRWNDLVRQPGIVINASPLCGRTQFQALQKKFDNGGPLQVKDVLDRFASAERPSVERTLAWAVKVGLLQLSIDLSDMQPTAAKHLPG